jgi:hypothetical protein
MKYFLLFTILFLGISFAQKQPSNTVLAKIGGKELTVEEFLYRSEFTVRPKPFKDKNITLNNLISEKILALEAEQNSDLMLNPALQGQLRGIKEQQMREKLYYEEAFNKVEIDTAEIINAYRLSMREYELEFYTLKSKDQAQKIEVILDSVPELTGEVFKELEETLGKKPVHKVKYLDPDDEKINEALYSTLLDTGAVVGPIRISNGDYIVMKVLNWTDYPLIGGPEQLERWNKVEEKIHLKRAGKIWQLFLAGVMKGKRLEFNKETLELLSDLAYKHYLRNNQNDSLNIQLTEIPSSEKEINPDAIFFTIDNKAWSIGDFKKELMSHPLVYRTRDLDQNNFNEQFKLAIVDMMRDHYLTKEAYKRDLDNNEEINKTVDMWKDAYLAADQQISIMNSAIDQGIVKEDDNSARLEYWENYLTALQNKYSDSTWINYNELDKIKLTNIDFIALQPGVPYPVVVPRFPMFIRSNNLNYANKGK